MKELIRKFTMGHPKQMTEPVIWYFLEGFTVGFPAVAVYFAINLFITYFNNPAIIFDKGYWNIALWLAGFFPFAVDGQYGYLFKNLSSRCP